MIDPQLARGSDGLFWAALVTYTVAMLAYLAASAFRKPRLQTVGATIAITGSGLHLGSIVARGMAADRVPWGNMFEYSSMIGFLLVAFFLAFSVRNVEVRRVGGLAMGAGVLALATARFVYVPAGPLVPALNSIWLKIHVLGAIIGSTLFGLSFIFTVLYLVAARRSRGSTAYAGSTVGAASLAPPTLTADGMPADHADDVPEPRRKRFADAELWDTMTLRTIQFAFPIWTFAVMAGAVWAHEAWGRYWGWDPKETWAFITWIVYAGYLHARATVGWRGHRAAVLSAIGFFCVLFTYFAVNLWISGLHSYAK
jgi:cytochrome c-type biogenesis protein CcsB